MPNEQKPTAIDQIKGTLRYFQSRLNKGEQNQNVTLQEMLEKINDEKELWVDERVQSNKALIKKIVPAALVAALSGEFALAVAIRGSLLLVSHPEIQFYQEIAIALALIAQYALFPATFSAIFSTPTLFLINKQLSTLEYYLHNGALLKNRIDHAESNPRKPLISQEILAKPGHALVPNQAVEAGKSFQPTVQVGTELQVKHDEKVLGHFLVNPPGIFNLITNQYYDIANHVVVRSSDGSFSVIPVSQPLKEDQTAVFGVVAVAKKSRLFVGNNTEFAVVPMVPEGRAVEQAKYTKQNPETTYGGSTEELLLVFDEAQVINNKAGTYSAFEGVLVISHGDGQQQSGQEIRCKLKRSVFGKISIAVGRDDLGDEHEVVQNETFAKWLASKGMVDGLRISVTNLGHRLLVRCPGHNVAVKGSYSNG